MVTFVQALGQLSIGYVVGTLQTQVCGPLMAECVTVWGLSHGQDWSPSLLVPRMPVEEGEYVD